MNAVRIEDALAERLDEEQCQPALEALFLTHYSRVARLIGRVIADGARAEELAVDVFLRWWREPSAHNDHAEGWLYRAATRRALDELRKRQRRARLERFLGRSPSFVDNPEQHYAITTEQQQVRSVLAILRRRDALMLLLRSDGVSYEQLAAILGLNPTSIGRMLSRAQTAFRKEYVKRYGDGS
jgi:RNA polymerase sigma-70 factor (ECF subfamily)